MNIRTVFALVMLGLSGQVLAEDSTPAAAADSDRRAVRASQPEKCAAAKKRFEEKCAADPKKCEEVKARSEAMRKQCAADSKACEAKKAEWRENMRERKAAPLPDTAPAS
jgi:Skp family chaperone for outer membrane proteins